MSAIFTEKTDVLTINYLTDGGHGTMNVDLRQALPCTASWLRKLLKVVRMSDKAEELEADLLIYMNELLDELPDPEDLKARQRSAEYAAGLQKTEVDKLKAHEKAQAGYVKLHVQRGDKQNKYRVMLDETREKLKTEKERLTKMEDKARDFKHKLEERERDEKRLRECLILMGQEGINAAS